MFWTVLDFLQKPLAWFSKFYLRVQSKNCGRNGFFVFLFRFFFEFWAKFFQTFGQKTSRSWQNYLLRVQTNNFSLEFFSKFWAVLDFLRKIWHGFQNSIFVSRETIPEKIIFLFFFSDFFRSLSERLSDFRPKNFKKLSKLPSAYADEQILAWEFFFKMFWTVLDFLQKPLAWFSKFYLRVHSKNCGRNGFFCFSFQNFFRILSKNFSDFWPKNFKKLTKLPSACSDEQFLAWNFFQKFWAVLDFLRKIWHVSQTSIFVSREKIPEEIIFLFFFSDFFRSLSETFFSDFWPKNFKKLSKLTSVCADEQFLAWEFFLNVFNRFGFSAETFGMVIKILSTCPE